MREILLPPLRATAVAAFIAGCLLLFFNPPSFAHLGGLMTIVVGAVAIVLITAWATTMAIGREMPEPSSGSSSIGARRSPPCRLPTIRRASSICL